MMNSTSLIIRDEEEHTNKKNKKLSKIDDEFSSRRPYIPEELMLGNIVIRLSAQDLARWSCLSKYWYKSILCDSRFASSHFDQNKNKLNLVFNLLNVFADGQSNCYFLSLEEEDDNLKYRPLMSISDITSNELVGYCNGLVCLKQMGNPTADRGQIDILNPTRSETFSLQYFTPPASRHLCQGFCFDSLSQQYKVVIIYTTTSAITDDQEFVCTVLTLGVRGSNTNSWRKSVTSTAQMSPDSTSPFPGRMITRPSRITRRSATLCGGDLFWRITNCIGDNDEIDMLLSFDIHNEKIRFISLPTECSIPWTITTNWNDQQCLVIDHHLLEFKGYLCVARSEKIMVLSKGHHHHYHRRRHRRIHCNGGRSRLCCCGFKVHLFVLKDKVNQVWIKEETFNLQIKEEQGLLPAPFCCYFDTDTSFPTTALPTRMLSFSDELFLYWSDGEYLLLYNLQMKYLKVIKCTSNLIDGDIFQAKVKNGIRPGRTICTDEDINFPYMDYQLDAQAENILSLKSFIPEGETRKFPSYLDFEQSIKNGQNKQPVGFLDAPRESAGFHVFY